MHACLLILFAYTPVCPPIVPTYLHTNMHTHTHTNAHTHTHKHTHTHHHVAMVCSAWPSYAHCMIAIHTKGPRVSCVVAPETICTNIGSWAYVLRSTTQSNELDYYKNDDDIS